MILNDKVINYQIKFSVARGKAVHVQKNRAICTVTDAKQTITIQKKNRFSTDGILL